MKQACKAAYDEWEYWENVDFGNDTTTIHYRLLCRAQERTRCLPFLRWKLLCQEGGSEFKKRKHDSDIKVEDHMIIRTSDTSVEQSQTLYPSKQLEGYVSKNAIIVWTTTKGIQGQVRCHSGLELRHRSEEKGEFIRTICDNIDQGR